jgi:hypothetical protein
VAILPTFTRDCRHHSNQIDHRTAALLLYALQTASANVKHTSFDPELPTLVVIDRECVERRPIGATAWSMVAGREYDEVEKKDLEKEDLEKEDGEGQPDSMAGYLAERMRVYTESAGEDDEQRREEFVES